MLEGIKYLMPRYAHVHCYLGSRRKKKGMMAEKDVIKRIIAVLEQRIKNLESTLNKDVLCVGKWRKELENDRRRHRRNLRYLKRLQMEAKDDKKRG